VPRLRRFAYALCGHPGDADDLVQVALERAIMRLDQWQPGTRLDSWVFRILHNAHVDDIRAKKRRGTVVDIDDVAGLAGGDAERAVQARLDLARTREAMDTLPDEQRSVLVLVGIEGLSYQEAADTLSIPIGTVMSRLSRARKALAARLETQGATAR